MNSRISNLEIDTFFENEENEDIKKNYMRVCSIDSSRRYIKFYEIIKKEMLNICLQYLIVINIIKQECIGRVFLILIKKKVIIF